MWLGESEADALHALWMAAPSAATTTLQAIDYKLQSTITRTIGANLALVSLDVLVSRGSAKGYIKKLHHVQSLPGTITARMWEILPISIDF